jgi:hypothetical protein
MLPRPALIHAMPHFDHRNPLAPWPRQVRLCEASGAVPGMGLFLSCVDAVQQFLVDRPPPE